MRGQLRIEQLYAFVALDPKDNTEGVPAFPAPNGALMPLFAADAKRVESLKPIARSLARQSGLKITLCRFEIRTELETYE